MPYMCMLRRRRTVFLFLIPFHHELCVIFELLGVYSPLTVINLRGLSVLFSSFFSCRCSPRSFSPVARVRTMSGSSTSSWSDNPNAPKIPPSLYLAEKAVFIGVISTVLYGIVIILFFRCMGALFSQANPTRGFIKWGLVAHTLAMFLFVTSYVIMGFVIKANSFIDNREFPGVGDMFSPGPMGYQNFTYTKALSVCPRILFLSNNVLADGLLLYRCYIIYARNHWVIAFPTLVYLASMAAGLGFIYETSQPGTIVWKITLIMDFGIPWFSISCSLNILLTLMIVGRLILYSKRERRTKESPRGVNGLYRAVATILIESCAIYAINSLLFIGLWGAENFTEDIFLAILNMTQVIAPFLIIQRVASRRALTSNPSTCQGSSAIGFRSRGETSTHNGTLDISMNSMSTYGKTSDEPDGNSWSR